MAVLSGLAAGTDHLPLNRAQRSTILVPHGPALCGSDGSSAPCGHPGPQAPTTCDSALLFLLLDLEVTYAEEPPGDLGPGLRGGEVGPTTVLSSVVIICDPWGSVGIAPHNYVLRREGRTDIGKRKLLQPHQPGLPNPESTAQTCP